MVRRSDQYFGHTTIPGERGLTSSPRFFVTVHRSEPSRTRALCIM